MIIFQHKVCTRTKSHLVRCGTSERSVGKTDTLVCSVEYGVESFKESEAIDKIETLAWGGANISDDEVDTIGVTTNSSVQCTL